MTVPLRREEGCFVLGRAQKWGLAPAGLGQVPVAISELDQVTPGQTSDSGPDKGDRHFAALGSQTKGTGTSLRSGASPLCLARSVKETALSS
jgi:hypothetical protein